jgi:hypothetical protein
LKIKNFLRIKLHFWQVLALSGVVAFLGSFVWSGGGVYAQCAQQNISKGDFDCSGKIDLYDLSYLLSRYGGADTTADASSDGVINIFDLSILLSHYNMTVYQGLTEVQDLINTAQAAGQHNVDLTDRNYDNSGGLLTIPAGMNLNCHQGTYRGVPAVTLQNVAGQSQAWAQGSNIIQNCHFVVANHPSAVGPGASLTPGLGYGFMVQSKVTFQNNRVEGGMYGVEVKGDHINILNNVLQEAYYGLYISVANTRGNMHTQNNDLTGNAMSSIAVSSDTEIDSWLSENDQLGDSPYCFFAEGHYSAGAHEYAVTNIETESWTCIKAGNRMIQTHDRKISGIFKEPHTGSLSGPAFTATVQPPAGSGADTDKAAIETGNLPSRTFDGNQWLILSAGGDDTNGSFPAAQGIWKLGH